jgi:hypothetical protein
VTSIDLVPIVLIIGYGVLGYFTGVLRRMIALLSVYLAFVAATNMGLQAGSIMQQSSTVETADARIIGFFGIALIVLVLIDGAAQLAHSQIQIQAVVLNKATGVIVGVITGVVLSVIVVHELEAAASPFGGGQLDQFQARIRDNVQGSRIAVPMVKAIGSPIIVLFQPVLPNDPQTYFGPGPVS